MKNPWLAAFLVVIGFVLLFGFTRFLERTGHLPSSTVVSPARLDSPKIGEVLNVKQVKVLEGHRFDIQFENGRRYVVSLTDVPGTPKEAKDAVVRLLNDLRQKEQKPVVVLTKWDDRKECYLGDLYFNDSRSDSLTIWLYGQNLAYSR